MIKRLLDIVLALSGLTLLLPLTIVTMLLVWLQDKRSPIYIATRIGRGQKPFQMVKIRSMIVAADQSGVGSTSALDSRITPVGHFIRRWKLDELAQLWNVLTGDMSLVGPRPNSAVEVAGYSPDQLRLLDLRPGITDFASIVFSDEGEILKGAEDPDELYRTVIWPWKSQLGLLYVKSSGPWLDLKLMALTLIAIVNRSAALRLLQPLLKRLGASELLLEAAARRVDILSLAPLPERSVAAGLSKSA